MNKPIHNTGQDYINFYRENGFNLIPYKPGGAPLVKWEGYKDEKVTDAEMEIWKKQTNSFAVLTGKMSGNLVCLDIDAKDLFYGMRLDVIARQTYTEERNGKYHIFLRTKKPILSESLHSKEDKEEIGIFSDGHLIYGGGMPHMKGGAQYKHLSWSPKTIKTFDTNSIDTLKAHWREHRGMVSKKEKGLSALPKGIRIEGSLLDIIRDCITLEEESVDGDEVKCKCPFPQHDDTHPSFSINAKKGFYHCWSCGRGGNAISFIKDFYGYTSKEAKEHLKQKGVLTVAEKEDEEEIVNITPINVEELLSVYKKWLYIEHDTDITVPFAFVISNFTTTDPGCLAIVAPSGSYKTELIRSLGESKNEMIYPLDNFTSHTLISGMPKVKDVIPDLNKRLITIKDFTSQLSKQEDERAGIFSDIREMLDGYITRSYGSGKHVNYRDIHSSILLGSTNALEGYYSLNAILGQRMIFFRPSNDPTKARERALKNMEHTEEMRIELHQAALNMLFPIIHNKEALTHLGEGITEDTKMLLGKYTDLVAIARTHVKRNSRGVITEIAEPEFPTRLFKEIIKIVSCHAILNNRTVSKEDLKAGLRVLLDNIPQTRFFILRKLAERPITGFQTGDIADALRLSSESVKYVLKELLTLNIVYIERISGSNRGDKWKIAQKFREVIQQFFDLIVSYPPGVNPGTYIYATRTIFETDLYTQRILNFNTTSKGLSETLEEEKEKEKITHVYTSPELPPGGNMCEVCQSSPTYLYSYNEKTYCDACLGALLESPACVKVTKKDKKTKTQTKEEKTDNEDIERIPKNVCDHCGRNSKTTERSGEWLCNECITESNKGTTLCGHWTNLTDVKAEILVSGKGEKK